MVLSKQGQIERLKELHPTVKEFYSMTEIRFDGGIIEIRDTSFVAVYKGKLYLNQSDFLNEINSREGGREPA